MTRFFFPAPCYGYTRIGKLGGRRAGLEVFLEGTRSGITYRNSPIVIPGSLFPVTRDRSSRVLPGSTALSTCENRTRVFFVYLHYTDNSRFWETMVPVCTSNCGLFLTFSRSQRGRMSVVNCQVVHYTTVVAHNYYRSTVSPASAQTTPMIRRRLGLFLIIGLY